MTPSTALAAAVLLVCATPNGQTKVTKLASGATVEACTRFLQDDARWATSCKKHGIDETECIEVRNNTRKWCRCEAH